ncbi:MAG: CDP-alcohol phosphatidyltransferase family protein [Acidobacteria bacterium]|nr:CDP-alcohol phosphatidyltransferase family protein [Acidobacteriota bacterium]
MQPPFAAAVRDQSSLLTRYEKPALEWVALRLPAWINPDHLTVAGFASMALAGLSYAMAAGNPAWLLAVNLWLAANWLGDSLDGTLARVRNRQRPRYGFYVDHITDAFGTALLLGGLALSGQMSPLVASGVLIVYFLISIEVYLATYTLGTFHLSFWKMGPTELRLLLAAGNAALLWRPVVNIAGGQFRLFDAGGAVALAAMAVVVIQNAVRHTATLYRAERM